MEVRYGKSKYDWKGVTKRLILRLFKNCIPQILEKIGCGVIGAVSPFQLLQIPAEIMGYSVANRLGISDNSAWYVGKACSLGMAVIVGATVAGSGVTVGAAACVVFGAVVVGGIAAAIIWLLGEVTSWLASKLLNWALQKIEIVLKIFCRNFGQVIGASLERGYECISGSSNSIKKKISEVFEFIALGASKVAIAAKKVPDHSQQNFKNFRKAIKCNKMQNLRSKHD